jgi:hypothetical protein
VFNHFIKTWFDRLTTNEFRTLPFVLSLSKDGPPEF